MNRRKAIAAIAAGALLPAPAQAAQQIALPLDARIVNVHPETEIVDDVTLEGGTRILNLMVTGYTIVFADGRQIRHATEAQLYDAFYRMCAQRAGDMIARGEVLDITGGGGD